jgi:hypothetical protein
MPEDLLKRPRDPAQLAKLMIDIASGEVEDRAPTPNDTGRTPPLSLWAGSAARRAAMPGPPN